jgi:hypothetical protein
MDFVDSARRFKHSSIVPGLAQDAMRKFILYSAINKKDNTGLFSAI